MISQRPNELFADGKLPKDLARIQSQIRELSLKQKEAILKRVANDATRDDLIKVAVIDSGVDIAHPDLQPFIDYKVVNNEIVGAGYDFMSGLPFGSSIFFDATIFAWGAKKINKGRIVEPMNSPLNHIEKANKRFRQLVIEGIKTDEKLNSSLFRHLSKNAFSIFGMYEIYKDVERELGYYKQNKENDELLNDVTLLTKDNKYYAKILDPKTGAWDDMEVDSSYRNHMPKAASNFSKIEHDDLFFNMVKESYHQIDEEFQFFKNMNQLKEFIALQNGIDLNDDKLEKMAIEKLQEVTSFIIMGPEFYNPLRQLEKIFRNNEEYRGLTLSESILKYLSNLEQMKEKLLSVKKRTKEEKKTLAEFDKNIIKLRALFDTVKEVIDDPKLYAKFKSDLRRSVYRSKHPYIHPTTNDNIHATHVSATIGIENPDRIRIIPIRVTTQNIALQEDVKIESAKRLQESFKEWSKSPYFEPLKQLILEEYGMKSINDQTLDRVLKKYLKENVVNTVFIEQLFGAIEKVGEMGAHIANVSLGTAFEKSYKNSEKLNSLVEDLFSEFVRFRVGELLRDKAPNTLFFVATGNEKAWIDSITRVAFPVGIRSLRMELVTKLYSLLEAPNNTVMNLIPVVSVNEQGYMTAFANQFVNHKEEALGSVGEEVLAPTPGRSKEGTKAIVSKAFRSTYMWLSKVSLMLTGDLLEDPERNSQSPEEREKNIDNNILIGEIAIKLNNVVTDLYHLGYSVNRQPLSGTSMAAPEAAKKSANLIISMLDRLHLKSKDLFVSAKVQLQDILAEINSHTEDPKYKFLTKVRIYKGGVKSWDTSDNEKALRKKISTRAKQTKVRLTLLGKKSCQETIN